MTIVFKVVAQKQPNKAFSVPKFAFFFRKILQLEKFDGDDLKFDNSFFKVLAQKYPNQAFLVPNLGIFVFSQNFAIRQIRGCLFKT